MFNAQYPTSNAQVQTDSPAWRVNLSERQRSAMVSAAAWSGPALRDNRIVPTARMLMYDWRIRVEHCNLKSGTWNLERHASITPPMELIQRSMFSGLDNATK